MDDDKLHDIILTIAWMIAGVIILWIFNSCSVCRNCEYKNTLTDSIYIERVDSIYYRDTIIQVQMRDSMVYMVADSSSHLETDIATSDAWIINNKLHHKLQNKRDLIPINVRMPMAVSHERHYIQKIVHQKVNYLSQMQSFWIVLGKFFAIALGVGLLLWLIKRRL